ncbi:MAG: metal-dependent hydrolase [Methanobacteriota archaeon]|nr:MAG: metal-dependent hydrolase [Euryarchaeota archaeon]
MDWKGHIIVGVALSFLGSLVVGNIVAFIWAIPLIILSSLMPDIDIENSKGKKLLDILVILFGLSIYGSSISKLMNGGYILVLALYGGYSLAVLLFKPKHRGITHTIVAAMAYSVLLYTLFGWQKSMYGAIAYMSHLVADRHIKII